MRVWGASPAKGAGAALARAFGCMGQKVPLSAVNGRTRGGNPIRTEAEPAAAGMERRLLDDLEDMGGGGHDVATLRRAGHARERLHRRLVALDDLVGDGHGVADQGRGRKADLLEAVGDDGPGEAGADGGGGARHVADEQRAVSDPLAVPGGAHELLVHVVSREVPGDAGEEVDVALRDG